MPTRYKRIHFFSGPATSLNDKLLTQNIPSELTMRQLLDSSAFINEQQDGASPTQQGLIKYYLNDDAITQRNVAVLQQGNIHALLPNQAPGTGVNKRGVYSESNPTPMLPGVSVSANGIKVTGMPHDGGGIRRVGHAVEFDGSTLEIKNPKGIFYFIGNNIDGDFRYLFEEDKHRDLSYEHHQQSSDYTWTVNHNLGKYPSVTLMDESFKEFEAEIQHTSKNQVIITIARTATTTPVGWCICN